MTDREHFKDPPVRLHLAHWLVLGASLGLTCLAWYFSKTQLEQRLESRFRHDADQVVSLLAERMEKYEGSLWAGVGMLHALGSDRQVTRKDWINFAKAIDLPGRYPGINGIGLIEDIKPAELESYTRRIRAEYPELKPFRVHPTVTGDQHYIISYIEPFENNRQAVGLDTAFETQRRQASERASAHGNAQISGPITLVQDATQTPGFLFLAPYQLPTRAGPPRTGKVYAAFVVRDLMKGALAVANRQVTVSARDGKTYLYQETQDNTAGFDPTPNFTREVTIPLYGRDWTFEIRSNLAFRNSAHSHGPTLVLAGGLIVDLLLLGVFLLLVSSNARAHRFARKMTVDLQKSQKQLQRRNDELIQFNYRVSHDLVAPLKTIQGLTDCIRSDIADNDLSEVNPSIDRIESMVQQQINVISSIFDLCEADLRPQQSSPIPLGDLIIEMFERAQESQHDATVRLDLDVPHDFMISAPRGRMEQILFNLLTNAIKFRHPEQGQPVVRVSAQRNSETATLTIADNGIGIPAPTRDRIFDLFFRAHSTGTGGAGLGTYIVRRNIENMGGTVEVCSDNTGTVFILRWPQKHAESAAA